MTATKMKRMGLVLATVVLFGFGFGFQQGAAQFQSGKCSSFTPWGMCFCMVCQYPGDCDCDYNSECPITGCGVLQ